MPLDGEKREKKEKKRRKKRRKKKKEPFFCTNRVKKNLESGLELDWQCWHKR